MERIGPAVVLTNRRPPRPVPPAFRYTLEVPGTCVIPEAGVVLEAHTEAASRAPVRQAPDEAVLDAGAAGRHLVVRNWQPGDRMRPMGLGGRKKLQDLFVDRRVPRDERGRVPVVVDARGRIAWVAGLAVGEEFRVPEGATGVVVLKLRGK